MATKTQAKKLQQPPRVMWVVLMLGVILGAVGYYVYSLSQASSPDGPLQHYMRNPIISTARNQHIVAVGPPACANFGQWLDARSVKLTLSDGVKVYGVCRSHSANLKSSLNNVQMYVPDVLLATHYTPKGFPKCNHFDKYFDVTSQICLVHPSTPPDVPSLIGGHQ